MYQERGGCGCGGGAGAATTGTARTARAAGTAAPRGTSGRIDSAGRCVCGECQECTGLQCLCRPRFFDGQLLTAADLRRLDQYVVQRSRLHNKHLHGVGVVCGLEVVCSSCDDTVTVRSGYALGPCGEDIVVCADASVDVARLIKAQRAASAVADCRPYAEPTGRSEAARQQWVLGVCYDEQPAHPVTSLKRTTSRCSCGGSCGGSCGSGTSAPAACEASQICEGYRFTLTRVPPGKTGETAGDPLPTAVRECLARLTRGLSQLPDQPSADVLVAFAEDFRDQLRDLIRSGNIHDCTLAQRLNEIALPGARDPNAEQRARAAVAAMLQLAVDLFRECVCSALLPPCSTGCADDCVPLATLTVRSSDLQVLEVCNFSARKFAITMPALNYWLGWLPIFGSLRTVLERLCCTVERRTTFDLEDDLRVRPIPTTGAGFSATNPRTASKQPAPDDPTSFVALGQQYRKAWTSLSGLEATVLGALGGRNASGDPLASDLELANPLAALAIGRVGVATGARLLPNDMAKRASDDARDGQDDSAEAPAAALDDRLASLEESLAGLKKTVESQARTIRTLRTKVQGK